MNIYTRRDLTPREVLSLLTDVPEDVSEYGDESSIDVVDDDFISAAGEFNSSSEDELQDSKGSMWHRWSCHVCISVFFNLHLLLCMVYPGHKHELFAK